MQKRNDTALALLGVILCALPSGAQQYRAFWADAYHYGFKSPAEIEQMLDDVTAARANAIIAEIRRDGGSYYLRSVEPPAEDPNYAPSFDALAYLIERAHARGIEVHAWFPVTPLWRTGAPPRDPRHLWYRHGPGAQGPDMWMTVSSSGAISTSLDPGHPAALQYLADLIVGVARDYDIDGLHLDYIRYPEDADYGSNPVAVARFNRLTNREGPPVPREEKWSDFRRKQVTDLVRQVYLRTFALKPAVKISAAVITWGNGPASDREFLSSDAYSRVFQDWRGWLEEGILDLAIPMNYFREQSLPAYLDRWMNFEKDRQYRRATLIGLGNYLNSVPDSIAQMNRVFTASPEGGAALGLAFYSYASTNILDASGRPVTPNGEFYKAVADYFGSPAAAPALPWKTTPDRGHAYGRLRVEDGPEALRDGATVWLEGAANALIRVETTTDATGFFGAVDLPPAPYFARLERGGIEIARTNIQYLNPGAAIRFDFDLRVADFAAVLPRLDATTIAAAPGDVVTLHGQALAGAYGPAVSVPLPLDLLGTQVLVNGKPAPLFGVDRERVTFQMPYDASAPEWRIVVRRNGLESNAIALTYVDAHPVIAGVRRIDGGYLEIYATGLGMVMPSVPAGTGAPASEPLARVIASLPVRIDGRDVEVLYMGLAPYEPGRYQVNVKMPSGVSGGTITIGDSAGVKF